jgi:hypothetical protein
MNTNYVFRPHPALLPMINLIMVKEAMAGSGQSERVYSYPPTPEHCIFLYLNSPIKARKLGEEKFCK